MKALKLFAIVVPVLCCFLLTACSAVNMGVYIYADGSIMQTYEVSLEKAELQKIGIDSDELLNKIDELTLSQWQNASNGKDLSGITFEVEKQSYVRIVKIKFASFDDYARFYEIDTSTPTEDNVEKTLFYNKKYYRDSESGYKTIDTTNVYNEIKSFLLTNYFESEEQMMENTKNIITSTTLVYPSSLKTKSNATYFQTTGNYDIYVWQNTLANELNGNNQTLKVWKTYYTIENRIAWYSLAVVMAIIFGLVLFVVLLIKKKKTKTQPTQPTLTSQEEIVLPPQLEEFLKEEKANNKNEE